MPTKEELEKEFTIRAAHLKNRIFDCIMNVARLRRLGFYIDLDTGKISNIDPSKKDSTIEFFHKDAEWHATQLLQDLASRNP